MSQFIKPAFTVEKRGGDQRPRIPFKPSPKIRRWSHQDDLVGLKDKRVKLSFATTGLSPVYGVLTEADQFTVRVDNQIYFKSALRSIGPESANDTE